MYVKINDKEYTIEWANPGKETVDIAFAGTTPKDIPSLVDTLISQNEFVICYGTAEDTYEGYNTIVGISFWSHVGYVVVTLQKAI